MTVENLRGAGGLFGITHVGMGVSSAIFLFLAGPGGGLFDMVHQQRSRSAHATGQRGEPPTALARAANPWSGSPRTAAQRLQIEATFGEPAQMAVATGRATVVQARGVTLALVKQAIGKGFRSTAGGRQESSDDELAAEGINCHFSVLVANPGAIHLSYYPADDVEYQRKIIHYAFDWNSHTEAFGTPSQTLGDWKPYRTQFGFFSSDASGRMQNLAGAIKQLLNAPVVMPAEPDFIPVPDVEAPPITNERYFGGPFPEGDDQEPMMFKRQSGAPAVQRFLHVQHNETSSEFDAVQHALESVFLNPPQVIAQAVTRIRDHPDIGVHIAFSEHAGHEDDFAFTDVEDDHTINVHINPSLFNPDPDDQIEEGSEPSADEAIDNERELQATVIHEFILHVMPAFERLTQQQVEPEDAEEREHGDAAGWVNVLATAESVGPQVLWASIVDTLRHLHHVPQVQRQQVRHRIQQAVTGSAGQIELAEDNAELLVFTSSIGTRFTLEDGRYVQGDVFAVDNDDDQVIEDDNEGQEEPEPQRYFGGPFPRHGDHESPSDMLF